MKAINFEQVNKVLKADGCHDLPVCWTGRQIIFCWQLSLRERFKVLLTGRLWHLIWAERAMIQPVAITTDMPFAEKMKAAPKGPLCYAPDGQKPDGYPFQANCIIVKWNVSDPMFGRMTEIQMLDSGRFIQMSHADALALVHSMEGDE